MDGDLKITQDEVYRALNVLGKTSGAQPEPVKTALFKGSDPGGGKAKSQTVTSCTLRIYNTDEELTIPVWTSAKVSDVANMLGTRLGVDPASLEFIAKKGCHFKKLWDFEEIGPRVSVKGITSFSRQPYPRKDPIAIIGAGHLGIKTAINLLKAKDTNFVVFDRFKKVGGTSWLEQANRTSKLQTEYGVYHVEYELDAPIPTYFTTPWPSRDELLEHFQKAAEEYGILPHCRMQTNVKQLEVVKHEHERHMPAWMKVTHLDLTLQKVLDQGETPAPEEIFKAFGVLLYPGNLTIPRRDTYKGEELFGGPIGYGMHSAFNYDEVVGKDVMIVGHGAFAVENVRTCCEYRSGKIYMVCRRKNIACPRITSWLANRSLMPITAGFFLDSGKPMYDLTPFDNWSYYAVKASADRSSVNIVQKARFGIGDIYFLAIHYGKLEVIEEPKGPIKRLTHHMAHLESGRKLEVSCILKLLGFYGDFDNDRLMKAKEMVGHWVNDDVKRFVWAEPISVQAQNFGGTSFSPGAISTTKMAVYFMNFPMDHQLMADSFMLPRFKGEPEDGRPVYVVDARHAVTTAVVISTLIPARAEQDQKDSLLKPIKQRLCHPIAKFVRQAKEDWDHYCKIFQEEGYDRPWPEYPYTAESVRQLVVQHMRMVGEPPLPSDWEDLGEEICKSLGARR